ncbi:phosphoadenylyl-sulfate reductase [Sphingomonas sp. PR090111-T3T-6A]|uniref:phosphoadenylyl-sulfate reductase n=1 Tax=Sphingomonas sp. PR090111-T3T-6A TaxID=685778 RepID=UPI00037EE8DA|nr:phosphoadenylyl-sulfate reductase [Sphingomonas sp. PR090111-T3T-6A]
MAEAVRTRDVIETGPRHTPADVIRLNTRFAGSAPADVLRAALIERLTGRTAVVSSFGAESAVLLHMVASIDPATPVIFLDTLKHFPETLAYRDQLIERLGLTDVRTIRPDAERLAARDATELRWSYDPDGCCEIRKVEPLSRALADFDATISGRKGFQSTTRTHIPAFEMDTSDAAGRIKLNPLAGWTKTDLDAYFEAYDLPRHPLEAQGYLSIGCSPCTSVVQEGEDPRAGRWRGWDKVECGIHTPADGPDQPSF